MPVVWGFGDSVSSHSHFSEAINGSVVRVPEIVAAKISSLHDNSAKYIENLKKLHGVMVLEKEEFGRRIKELRTEFEDKSKNLPEMKVDQIFITGATTKNLENLKTIGKELESMPEKTGEMKKLWLYCPQKNMIFGRALSTKSF